jgi:hypothetical protein
MGDTNRFPYWIVKRGDYWVKEALSGAYLTAMAENTPDKSIAARFGRDMAQRVAAFHNGRVIKITGAKRRVHLALCLDNSSSMSPVAVAAKAVAQLIRADRMDEARTGSTAGRSTAKPLPTCRGSSRS